VLVVPLVCLVAALVGIGAVRVRTQCRILELGEDLAALATEQAGLLDLKRRLEAERAYLRHPEHVREVAEQRLDMVPVDPAWIRTIRTTAEEKP
jgi:cell division protein FtsL